MLTIVIFIINIWCRNIYLIRYSTSANIFSSGPFRWLLTRFVGTVRKMGYDEAKITNYLFKTWSKLQRIDIPLHQIFIVLPIVKILLNNTFAGVDLHVADDRCVERLRGLWKKNKCIVVLRCSFKYGHLH